VLQFANVRNLVCAYSSQRDMGPTPQTWIAREKKKERDWTWIPSLYFYYHLNVSPILISFLMLSLCSWSAGEIIICGMSISSHSADESVLSFTPQPGRRIVRFLIKNKLKKNTILKNKFSFFFYHKLKKNHNHNNHHGYTAT
jgi:hypothetical protein